MPEILFVEPINDRVVIKRTVADWAKRTELFLPDSVKESSYPNEGIVMAAGDKATKVKAGDRVLYGKYLGQQFTLGEDDFTTVREDDIIGVIKRVESD